MKAPGFAGLPSVLVLALIVAVGTASCIRDTESREHGTEVSFGMDGGATRALSTTSLRKIGVFGYSHAGSYATAKATSTPDYFLNQSVIDRNDDGNWTYSGVVKYWPRDGRNVSFFAYAPYIDVEDTFELYPAMGTDSGAPTIYYKVPASIYDQIDLLWNGIEDQTYNSNMLNNGVVEFTMDHALTRVNFLMKINDAEKGRPYLVEITELTVRNVVGEGLLDLSCGKSDADLWTTQLPATDADWAEYTMTTASGLKPLVFDTRVIAPAADEFDPFDPDFNAILTDGHQLMLIPQVIADQGTGLTQAQVVIGYSYTNVYSGITENDEVVLNLSQGTLTEWKAGQGINYGIILSLVEGTIIEFDIEGFITGKPWEPDGDIGGAVN